VSAFFSRWRQWRAEAEALVVELERAGAELPAAALQEPADSPEDAATVVPMVQVASRPSPAQVNVVVEGFTAAQGRAPSVPELVAALRARFGISRATAYRASVSARNDVAASQVDER
jgi:hypothetical protein